jgi:Smg protein
MKGKMFDVVSYITHRYGRAEEALENPGDLRDELADAGYREDEVERAFAWLRRLRAAGTAVRSLSALPSGALRVASAEEAQKLTPAARGYLLRLEQSGIIDLALRETVYERALTVDVATVDVPEVRVLVALLLSAPGRGSEDLARAVLSDDFSQHYH